MQRRVLLFFVLALCHVNLAAANEPALQAGVAVVDITPPPGQTMWGYANRPQPATGKLDPLMGRVVVLACGPTRVALVTLDLGRTPEDLLLAELRERTLSKHRIGDLFVTASHTHAAPSLESLDGKPNSYGPTVIDALDRAIDQAADNLVPVTIGVGRGTVDLAHNRRHFLPDGRVAMQWRNAEHEPTSPVDKEYVVVRLDRADGKPLAVLLHYACHPVVLGPDNLEYSADFVGEACRGVEAQVGAPCLYLQGGCGNINPYVDKTPRSDGGVELMRKMGQTLAAAVVETAKEIEPMATQPDAIKFDAHPVSVRLRWDVKDPDVAAVLSKMYGARFDRYLAPMLQEGRVRPILTTLLIGKEIALCGMPGEFFVQFQTDLKEHSPVPTTLLVGYTNGYHAYFPTIRDAAAGGYGGKTATYVAPGSGEKLRDEALVTLYKMLDKLHDVPREEDFHLIEYDDVKKQVAQ
ncbi:MAG TPA: neutral/alkaline non-lysosomal ceramidase N-terminal domain-containing protein [Pirellulales bacterium]|nr:neutral/alkaline non-lysosomal ceramidase N-terminal domain-containing protein [Pirellulales bacterium]